MAKARVIRCGGGLRYYIKRFPVMCIYASVFVVCMILFCSWLFSWKGIWFVPKQDLYWPVPACILGDCFANVCAYYLDGAGWHISLFVGKVIAFYFIIRFAHDLWVAEQGWIHLPSWLKYVI